MKKKWTALDPKKNEIKFKMESKDEITDDTSVAMNDF